MKKYNLNIDIEYDINGIYHKIERQLSLAIKPKPRWIPKLLYNLILRHLLILEYFNAKTDGK